MILKSLRGTETKHSRASMMLPFALLVFAACQAATPAKQEPEAVPTPAKAPQASGIVFRRSADDVQKAAANALAVKGFEIKKEERMYVEGARPRTLGVMAAETVAISLESLAPDRTRVRIETRKPAVAFGSKDWDAAVLQEMEGMLGKRE